jgi:hypothetical protein
MQVVGGKSALGIPFGLLTTREREGEGGTGCEPAKLYCQKNTTTIERKGKGKVEPISELFDF